MVPMTRKTRIDRVCGHQVRYYLTFVTALMTRYLLLIFLFYLSTVFHHVVGLKWSTAYTMCR